MRLIKRGLNGINQNKQAQFCLKKMFYNNHGI